MQTRKQPDYRKFESRFDRKAKVSERNEIRQRKESAYLNTLTDDEDDEERYVEWYNENRG